MRFFHIIYFQGSANKYIFFRYSHNFCCVLCVTTSHYASIQRPAVHYSSHSALSHNRSVPFLPSCLRYAGSCVCYFYLSSNQRFFAMRHAQVATLWSASKLILRRLIGQFVSRQYFNTSYNNDYNKRCV